MLKSSLHVALMVLAVCASRSAAQAEDALKMDPQVHKLLQNRCSQCHGGGVNAGGIGPILDIKNLLERGIVVAGNPEASQIIQLTQAGQMPPGQRLGSGDIALLRAWIQNLPPALGAVPPANVGLPIIYSPAVLKPIPSRISVLQHHGNAMRDGHYVVPSFNKKSLSSFKFDQEFNVGLQGAVYAQPLYVEKGSQGRDVLLIVTEANQVYGLDGQSGEVLWTKSLGAPVNHADMPCGNIDPLGITGTPVVDSVTNTFYFDAMETPDSGRTKHHMIYRMSVTDGSIPEGWPIDAEASLKKIGQKFNTDVQNERGALALVTDKQKNSSMLYVPYGGHWGDCGDYRGWVVGLDAKSPTKIFEWHTGAQAGGIWAPGGVAATGSEIFVSTGNTEDTKAWAGGEAILRLPLDLSYKPTKDSYFSPKNWKSLDDDDADVGGVAPVLIDVPDDAHSKLAVGFGKDGFVYVTDRNHLGGLGGALVSQQISSGQIITASTAYTTATGTYVVVKATGMHCPSGQSGDLTALRITTQPKVAVTTAWCGSQNGTGSPIVTTIDGHQHAVVWSIGAEGDETLHAFDGETGKPLKTSERFPKMPGVQRFQSAIVTGKGRMFIVGDGKVYVYSVEGSRLPASIKKTTTKKTAAASKSS